MSENKKKLIIKGPDAKISKEDKKRLEKAINKAKKEGKFPATAQETLPYRVIYKNGMCQLDGYDFSKTIAFEDINYKLIDNTDKKGVYDRLSEFYNYFN